jgi:glycosyltransferase involved in cell wall biosynthesis
LNWIILSGEYPPAPGGVSDYTARLAKGLYENGRAVEIWTGGRETAEVQEGGITVHRSLGEFRRRDMRPLDDRLATSPGATLLVQYVPHAFRCRAMNIGIAYWLAGQARTGRDVRVMFHEVAFPFVRRPIRHNLLAVAHRWMARTIARSKLRVYTSTEAWHPILQYYGCKPFGPICLPIPSNIGVEASNAVDDFRRRFTAGNPAGCVVGHFGTFGGMIRKLTLATLKSLLKSSLNARVVLIGRGAETFRVELSEHVTKVDHRLFAIDNAEETEISAAIQATDIMFQPYPDGITTRRTSAMAGLANGIAVVSNEGPLTESFWREEGIAALASAPDPRLLEEQIARLLSDDVARQQQSATGRTAYGRRFSIEATIEILLRPL